MFTNTSDYRYVPINKQLLKDWVSWGSPGKCSIIDRFLGDSFGFCPARFGVLFCSVVLGCRYTPQTTGPCSQWCPVSNWWCVLVWHCSSSIPSQAILCMLYKIRCNPVHPLNGALPLVAHRYAYAPPRCRTSQHRVTFIPLSVYLWIDLDNPAFDGVLLAGFKSMPKLLYWPKLLYRNYSLLLIFHFSSFSFEVGFVGLGSSDW